MIFVHDDNRETKKKILKQYDNNKGIYEHVCTRYKQLLGELIDNSKILYNTIDGRVKNRDSLSKKIDSKKGKYSDISDITDIVGIRIITYYSDDVDRIAELIGNEFTVDLENTIDKRKALEPDRFGYLSLHYIVSLNQTRSTLKEYQILSGVKVEIQIRTILQHAWAEIEHDLGYKSEVGIPTKYVRKFSQLASLLEIADKEFMEIRNELNDYREHVESKIEHEEMIDIPLDAVSLRAYVNHSQIINEMNEYIHNACNLGTFDAEENDYIKMVQELQFLGCKDIKMLESMIYKNKTLALKIAVDFLERGGGAVDELVSLFYICYAHVINEEDQGESIEKLCQYIYDIYPLLTVEDDNGIVELYKKLYKRLLAYKIKKS